jgi:hypothetical protein
MPLHETKNCPRCHQPFQCKAGDISHCGCAGIVLTTEEQAFIESRYQDCLCLNCLKELKNKYILFKEKYFGS